MEKSDEDAVIAAERSLLDPRTRQDKAHLEALLDDEFEEIGKSGRHWTRAETIAALAAETGTQTIHAENFAASSLGPDVILLTFESEADGVKARRASIWRKTESGWKLRFHQATPAN